MIKTQIHELTIKQLNRDIEKFAVSRPEVAVKEPGVIFDEAIAARFPGVDPYEVLRQAEINWLREVQKKMVSDASRNLNEWIDTTVQGDMFDNEPRRVPKYIRIDGKNVPYYKANPTQMLGFLQARAAATLAEGQAFKKASDEKMDQHRELLKRIRQTEKDIRLAEENGIDPTTVRYAKQD